MSSIQGRFTGVDPDNAGAVFDDPQSWNGYVYVGNHPTTTTDPSGLVWAWHSGSRNLHWFDTRGEYQDKADKEPGNWQIVDGQDFFVTRSGAPNNPYHDYLRSGHRYTLYADGAVFDATAPYYNAAGALARQMQLRATATKQALIVPAIISSLPVAIIFGGEAAAAYMYGTGITTLGLATTGAAAAGEVALANPERTVQVLNATGEVLSNFSRFVSKLPTNARSSAVMVKLEDGTYRFIATSAGRVPGSRAIYEKTVDVAGKTIGYIKTTILPDGSIAHIKDKLQ